MLQPNVNQSLRVRVDITLAMYNIYLEVIHVNFVRVEPVSQTNVLLAFMSQPDLGSPFGVFVRLYTDPPSFPGWRKRMRLHRNKCPRVVQCIPQCGKKL